MRVHPKNREIIGTIISLANGLSMNVVAEGVETEEQLNGLRKLGCSYAQGFHFARPLPAEKIEELLRQNPIW
jgi:EAL domain-containing protein (putative c-di-GMP-specific phosphodiesterase class I)